MFFKALRTGCISTLVLFSLACGGGIMAANAKSAQSNSPSHFTEGGTIEINVQGEEDLSNTYYIDMKGHIDMPLIGAVRVTDKTPTNIKNEITEKLKDGYLKNPMVTVKAPTLIHTTSIKQPDKAPNEKTVYVIGGVKKPGYYTLPENAHHVLSVVAIAGGYTDKADKKEFEIVRNIDGKHYRKTAQVGAIDYIDGDIIIIKERF